jgi:hypothetical protein
MSGQSKKTWEQFSKAGREAFKAGLYTQAAKFYRQAREVAAGIGDEESRVNSLYWEGECYTEAGQDVDRALSLLLEAASADAVKADPADIFNARTTAISIALTRNPVALTRKLLAETWLLLERLGQEAWGSQLHHLEGELESLQGNYEGAYRAESRAWHIYKPKYPHYVRAVHLYSLCRACFDCHDFEKLLLWVEALEGDDLTLEQSRIDTLRARLLSLRAAEDRFLKFEEMAEVSRSILRRQAAMETDDGLERLASLRGLALGGCFSEIEGHLEGFTVREKEDRFELSLFRGDFALCRARAELGAEARDDEWDLEYPLPQPPFPSREAGLQFLAEAEGHFADAVPVATEEDERLETQHYSRTLAGRLERVRALRQAVEASA